jgi:hypothetical protein
MVGPIGPLLSRRTPIELGGEPVELGVVKLAHCPSRPREAKPTRLPAVQARRHTQIDSALTRSRAPISPVGTAALCTPIRPGPSEDHVGALSVINESDHDLSTSVCSSVPAQPPHAHQPASPALAARTARSARRASSFDKGVHRVKLSS